MLILAVDTSTEYCSVALLQDDELLQEINDKTPYSHNKKLFKNIDTILKTNEIDVNDIELLAIGSGPGSFTGLRVGMSAMKGISLASNIKLLPIRSIDAVGLAGLVELEGLAGLEHSQVNVVRVLLDGKQKDMFIADYKLEGGNIILISDIIVKGYDELEGTGNISVGNISKDIIKINDYYDEYFPKAYYIGKIAYQYRDKKVKDLEIEPQYYKNFKISKSKKVPLIDL
ncbi:MAG: tRNA (adenosine(37)-N6)-threonylcarbamoyltransferase complex dimerization subunit type 1 TsaB [Candidatus Delongbacteria bacterium]|nr:tRNA (adenosine(37)-N6)-threonylcarbamoyltransferase complex dimerization subunit type 1 TsaB [Candidatus Delongbacteria bacterium]